MHWNILHIKLINFHEIKVLIFHHYTRFTLNIKRFVRVNKPLICNINYLNTITHSKPFYVYMQDNCSVYPYTSGADLEPSLDPALQMFIILINGGLGLFFRRFSSWEPSVTPNSPTRGRRSSTTTRPGPSGWAGCWPWCRSSGSRSSSSREC